jgi:hypothetical protein
MKLLATAVPSPLPAPTSPAAATPTTQAATATRRSRLPRDAVVQFNGYPAELYVSMTITRPEHIAALMETLNTYAPQLQFARRRDDDR